VGSKGRRGIGLCHGLRGAEGPRAKPSADERKAMGAPGGRAENAET